MSRIKKLIVVVLSCLMLFALVACDSVKNPSDSNNPEEDDNTNVYVPYDENLRVEDTRSLTPQQYTMYNTTGVDDFGRTILTVDGQENGDKYVGLFYFLWLGTHAQGKVIFDISKITKDGQDNDAFQTDTPDTPTGYYHHWGESAFGYYNSTDEWVIRKHVEMFVAAGIDFLVFDCTNGFTYQNVAKVLFNVLLEYQEAGWNVPKIMYYLATPGSYLRCLKEVYNFAYATDTYKSLWFCPDGKPLITMHQDFYDKGAAQYYGLNMSDATEKAMFELFEFKARQWPNEAPEEEGVPWMDFNYPQYNHNGWMNVSIGQHVTIRFSDLVGTQARGYDPTTMVTDHSRWREDINFQGQWKTVLDNKDDVRFAFMTGWNEWIAIKMKDANGVYFTVDTYNAEYSRDIEPSENNGDNSYLLMTQKVREYNYTEAKHYIYPKTTLDITKDDEAWANVKAEYVDFTNDCKDRDAKGYTYDKILTPKYVDRSGRNDISTVKVARDDEYVYFRVTVAGEKITDYESGDKGWMNIWLKTQNAAESYNGYNYVLNRSVDGNKTTVQKASGGKLVDCGTADLFVEGNVMVVRAKLSDLGLSATNYDIEFKVTDNVKEADEFNYLDYYRTGDSAPIGRLNYKYGY